PSRNCWPGRRHRCPALDFRSGEKGGGQGVGDPAAVALGRPAALEDEQLEELRGVVGPQDVAGLVRPDCPCPGPSGARRSFPDPAKAGGPRVRLTSGARWPRGLTSRPSLRPARPRLEPDPLTRSGLGLAPTPPASHYAGRYAPLQGSLRAGERICASRSADAG